MESPTNLSCDLWTLVLLCCPAPTEASRGRSVAPLSLRQRSLTTAGLVCIFHNKNVVHLIVNHSKWNRLIAAVMIIILFFFFSQESVMMQFCGNKLDKKDFFGKSDPFLVFYRSNEDGTWVVFLLSPSLRPFPLRFHVCCNPVLHPEEIGFIDSSQIESQAACVDHVRKPAVAAKKKVLPLDYCVWFGCACLLVCVLDPAPAFFLPCSAWQVR